MPKKKHEESPEAVEESTPIGDQVEEETHENSQEPDQNVEPKVEEPEVTGTEEESGEVVSDDDQHDVLEPGDEGYSPSTDPKIPNSWLAEQVAEELKSGSSPTRDALLNN